MEDLQKFALSMISKNSKSSSSSPITDIPYNSSGGNGGVGLSAALSSSDQSRLLLNRSSRQVVSMWTCSKLCAAFFVAGVFVGFTLKRRVRRLASKLLRRIKDN